jgi:hypothetical protein
VEWHLFWVVRSGMYITHRTVASQYIYKLIHTLTNSMQLNIFFSFSMAQQPLVGQVLFIIGGSRSH